MSLIDLPQPEDLRDRRLFIDPESRAFHHIVHGTSERRWRPIEVGEFVDTEIIVRAESRG